MTTRRNILTLLGLAGVSTATVAAESIAQDTPEQWTARAPGLVERSVETQEKIAMALERMANGIRSGELMACGLKITSDVKPDSFLAHQVIIDVEILV